MEKGGINEGEAFCRIVAGLLRDAHKRTGARGDKGVVEGKECLLRRDRVGALRNGQVGVGKVKDAEHVG